MSQRIWKIEKGYKTLDRKFISKNKLFSIGIWENFLGNKKTIPHVNILNGQSYNENPYVRNIEKAASKYADSRDASCYRLVFKKSLVHERGDLLEDADVCISGKVMLYFEK